MAERRAKESAGRGGWPATLALGVVGVAAGFAVGIVAGISWEEPALVFDYVTGDTEQVDWSLIDPLTDSEEAVAGRSEEPLPEVAAPPPRAVVESKALPARPHAGTEAASAPVDSPDVRKPMPGGGFSVQVGAFSDSQAAHALADALRAQGFRVYLSRGEGDGAAWRVRVGPVQTRADAEREARRLKSRENLPTWILSEGS
jgi:cell division septation protein DedD